MDSRVIEILFIFNVNKKNKFQNKSMDNSNIIKIKILNAYNCLCIATKFQMIHFKYTFVQKEKGRKAIFKDLCTFLYFQP